MKTAIIVGCNGQDGRLLYNLLLEKEYAIIGIARETIRTTLNIPIKSVDIAQEAQVTELIKETKPDEVYYLAAFHYSAEDVHPDNVHLFHRSHQVHVTSLMKMVI